MRAAGVYVLLTADELVAAADSSVT